MEQQYLLPYLTGVKDKLFFNKSLFYIENVTNDVVASHMSGRRAGGGGGGYFLVPRKFNEMMESISTKLDNDSGQYF